MIGTRQSCSCDDVDFYKSRAEELEQRERDREERNERERERTRKEREQARQEWLRTAAGWEDAFGKQLILVGRELAFAEAELEHAKAGEYGDGCGGDPVGWWQKDVDTLKAQIAGIMRAQDLYRERMSEVQAQYDRLRREALEAIAAQLEAEKADSCGAADHMREDNPSEWLNW